MHLDLCIQPEARRGRAQHGDVGRQHLERVDAHRGHGALRVQTTSALSANGAAELPGADALYIGQTYELEVGDGAGVSARTTKLAVTAGAGKMRVEGKDYIVAEGDVMEFLFNV